MYAGMDNLQTIPNIDDNGHINIDYYKAATSDIIKRFIDDRGFDPAKLTSNQLQAALRQCYYALFAPDKRPFNNNACNIPYTAENIRALLLLYADICELYQALPSLFAFERFTGLTEETVQTYVTDIRLAFQKSRKSAIQNKLYEGMIGVITLANNDSDSGLMYNRQNIQDQATVKKALNFSELVQIAQRKDKPATDDNGGQY